ncbi:MAG TPA: ribosome biogenesis GTPase Der [Candidatus Competibacteraceae bacterium]|nr:ribosome biogenesis GTPase Der [Candidatus Competibacteraceae bacterium]
MLPETHPPMSRLPVIALVGRPNVGKSTLFNCLTRSRDALVADMPGLTRDRQYGTGQVGPRPYVVMDTGGLSGEDEGIDLLVAQQVWKALEDEVDAVLFLVDGRAGLSAGDEEIAARLRRLGKPLWLVVNKTDGLDRDAARAEFHALALGEPQAIAASHGRGVAELMERVLAGLPQPAAEVAAVEEGGIRLAIVGRPNVGKSTLVNRLLGEERVLACDLPGTTRDSISIPFEKDGQRYTLIDTAGVRRRSRVDEVIEKFSVLKTLQAIERAHVVVLVLDARQGIAEQDAHLLGHVLDSGRGLVVAVNKWDRLEREVRDQVRRDLDRKLAFLDFARVHFISALHGTGVMDLLASVREAYAAATRKLSTHELTRILEQALEAHQPPLVHGRSIKLRYAHQGGQNPPRIVIHGNRVDQVPDAYRRYLVNTYRRAFDLWGTPVRIEFRSGDNPYQPGKPVKPQRHRPVKAPANAPRKSPPRRRSP